MRDLEINVIYHNIHREDRRLKMPRLLIKEIQYCNQCPYSTIIQSHMGMYDYCRLKREKLDDIDDCPLPHKSNMIY